MAQTNYTIIGNLAEIKNTELALRTYNLDKLETLSITKTNDKGDFKLEYPETYSGAAVIEIKGSKSVIVLLNKENFELYWNTIQDYSALKFVNSFENNSFTSGIELYQNTSAKLAGLNYLLPYYAQNNEKRNFFLDEIKAQNKSIASFLNTLPKTAYVNYYLKIRKLVADLNNNKKIAVEDKSSEFENIDFTDQKLVHSGLYFELLDNYFILLEENTDSEFTNIKKSVAIVLQNLDKNATLKQAVAEHLFNHFEKRSLTKVSETIALNMLSDTSCKLDSKLEALFEQYRKMAIGTNAPKLNLVNCNQPNLKFDNINSNYKLLVFGASWCQKCTEELPKLKTFYTSWKQKYNLEIIFISLDTEMATYKEFVKNFPWISSCDLKGWEGAAAREYFVFASPTLFLVDKKNTVLLKPTSPEQLSSWLLLNKK